MTKMMRRKDNCASVGIPWGAVNEDTYDDDYDIDDDDDDDDDEDVMMMNDMVRLLVFLGVQSRQTRHWQTL